MIKGAALIVSVLFIIGSVALAEEASNTEDDVLTPDHPAYSVARSLEEVQYDLSEDPAEQALQQNEFAGRRMKALQADEKGEHAENLLREMEEHEGRLCRALEALAENGEEEDLIEEISKKVEEATQMRSRRLVELSEDETMPEQAREGASKAIQNQVKAMEKAYQAMENARRGLDREDVDPEELKQEARERARENMPDEVKEHLPDRPGPGSEDAGEGEETGEDTGAGTREPDNTETRDNNAGEDATGVEKREEKKGPPEDRGRGNQSR